MLCSATKACGGAFGFVDRKRLDASRLILPTTMSSNWPQPAHINEAENIRKGSDKEEQRASKELRMFGRKNGRGGCQDCQCEVQWTSRRRRRSRQLTVWSFHSLPYTPPLSRPWSVDWASSSFLQSRPLIPHSTRRSTQPLAGSLRSF